MNMKLKLLSAEAAEKGTITLPAQFEEPVRKDLIKRAVLSLQAGARQPYGAKPEAGKRYSSYVSKRRRNYKGTYGIGQSRTPRKILTKRGTQFYFVGAFAPQTVGGRRAHPPKASKNWEQKINETENRKAIRSALAATMQRELVKARGHKAPEAYPFIISSEFETITKAAELKKALTKLGLQDEMSRASEKKVRGGKGKNRGRKYKLKKSILFVTSKKSSLEKAAGNFPGVDVATIESINAELLAPGTQPGRLTLYTEQAIKMLAEKKLFTKEYKGAAQEKKEKPEAAEKPKKKPEQKKEAPTKKAPIIKKKAAAKKDEGQR
jgi:large subunit ribosomal protein L4e